MDQKQYEHVGELLGGLKDVVDDLNETSRSFVQDQIRRHKRWGQDMLVSPKQLAWLESLHEEFVGTGGGKEAPGVDDKMKADMEGKDFNDEVPF